MLASSSCKDQSSEPIRLRVVIDASRKAVYQLLRTDSGRSSFWAEQTIEKDGIIDFRFPNGLKSQERILHDIRNEEFALTYLGSRVTFRLTELDSGCEVEVTDEGVSHRHRTAVTAGWVSVLMALKAFAGHQIDLRNHDATRTWDHGYVDN